MTPDLPLCTLEYHDLESVVNLMSWRLLGACQAPSRILPIGESKLRYNKHEVVAGLIARGPLFPWQGFYTQPQWAQTYVSFLIFS